MTVNQMFMKCQEGVQQGGTACDTNVTKFFAVEDFLKKRFRDIFTSASREGVNFCKGILPTSTV